MTDPLASSGQALSPELRASIGQFALWLANGSVGHPLLDEIDYSYIFTDPSVLEMVFIVYTTVLRLDERGVPINPRYAEYRAAQYIHQIITGTPADPPFELWEQELPGHPPFHDGMT